jgi:Ser/Thr protein kinase RdoA (MazF antagonist)
MTPRAIHESLALRGFPDVAEVQPIKERNHVWRLRLGGGTTFLKVYTKDWYAGGDTGFCVDHEAACARRLHAAGLAGMTVLDAVTHADHPLGHPFLLTAAVPGIDAVARLRDGADEAVLAALGGWLRRCHGIAGLMPGYLSSRSPAMTVADGAWRHASWTWPALLAEAERHLAPLPADLAEAIRGELRRGDARIWYEQPVLIHGDCHAHQFFLAGDAITGVVDWEVGGFGAAGHDLVTLVIELAGVLRGRPGWWEPLWHAYGPVPFHALRALLLVRDPWSFRIHGAHRWPGNDAAIRRHLLAARGWDDLFDLNRIVVP